MLVRVCFITDLKFTCVSSLPEKKLLDSLLLSPISYLIRFLSSFLSSSITLSPCLTLSLPSFLSPLLFRFLSFLCVCFCLIFFFRFFFIDVILCITSILSGSSSPASVSSVVFVRFCYSLCFGSRLPFFFFY